MTKQAINEAIALLTGWTNIKPSAMYKWEMRGTSPTGDKSVVPDFCGDLNAIHDAEMTLRDSRIDKYEQELDKVVPLSERWIRSTALQRAEAFLRTCGAFVDETETQTKEVS